MNSAWLACLMFWRSIWVTIKNTINFTSATSLDINEVQKLQNLLLPLICCTYKPAKVLCIQKPFTTNHNILMYFMFFVCLLIYLLNIACLWKILQLKWSILYVLSLNIFLDFYHSLNNHLCIDIYHFKIKIFKYNVEFYNRYKSCYKNLGRN